jgi:hypothetical protein
MEGGERLPGDACDIDQARSRVAEQVSSLDLSLRGLDPADPPYPVIVSEELEEDRARISQRFSWVPPETE